MNSRGEAKPTRFMGAYVVVVLDLVSDGANAEATAAMMARHRKILVREIIVLLEWERRLCYC